MKVKPISSAKWSAPLLNCRKGIGTFKAMGMRFDTWIQKHDKHIAYVSHLSHISAFCSKTVINKEKTRAGYI
jgi:prephenate dehydrogenase